MDIIDRKYNEIIKILDINDNNKYNYNIYNILYEKYNPYYVILYFHFKLKIDILESK